MGESKSVIEIAYNILDKGWNKQIILYGPPGTSKTYFARIVAAYLLAEKTEESSINTYSDEDAKAFLSSNKERIKIIQFHPSYTYEDFVRGIKVEPDKETKQLTYRVEKKIIERMSNFAEKQEEKVVLIIDEINRAPLASVLGELIYGLEYRGAEINTPYEPNDNEPLRISENLYIIGTMNTADRSIGSMDYAVRRRFAFVQVPALEPKENDLSWKNMIKNTWKMADSDENAVGDKACEIYQKIYNMLKEKDNWEDNDIDPQDLIIGHTYFLGKEQHKDKEYLEFRMKYQVIPLLEEYVKDGLLKKTIVEDEIKTIISEELKKLEGK